MKIYRLTPWLPERAIAALEQILNEGKDLKVFEYGMGASTPWILMHKNVKRLISVEHDSEWDLNIFQIYKSIESKTLFTPIRSNRPYADVINTVIELGKFDIILIDGRDRVKCIEAAIPHLKSGGVLILDNSEREYYQKGIDLMDKWDKQYFKQPEPDRYGFTYPNWKCTFFYKPIQSEIHNPKSSNPA